jgi:hypothetical protein
LVVAAMVLGCGDDAGGGADAPRDTGVPRDESGAGDADADASLDELGSADADAAAETAADGDGTTGDGGGRHGPNLIYDGPRGDDAIVPGWDPDRPVPIIVFARYDAADTWYVSMAEIGETGVVGGMVTERVRFWGWGDLSAYAPSLLYEGALGADSRIPGWSAAEPFPVIVLTRYAGERTWFASMATIDATGLLGGPVTDEVRIWGWTSDGAEGAPAVIYDGPRDAGAVVPGWSVGDPPPLIVLTKYATGTDWWLSMAEVSGAGVVGGMVTDWLHVFGW